MSYTEAADGRSPPVTQPSERPASLSRLRMAWASSSRQSVPRRIQAAQTMIGQRTPLVTCDLQQVTLPPPEGEVQDMRRDTDSIRRTLSCYALSAIIAGRGSWSSWPA
jgi:hypothetical protein